MVIILVYKLPSPAAEEFTDQTRIDNYPERLEIPTPNIILPKDFNLPNVKWKNGSTQHYTKNSS